MTLDWDDYLNRSDEARTKIFGLEYSKQRDLLKILMNMEQLEKQISVEAIECRRHKTTTRHYTELENQLEESLKLLEQYLLFAILLNENK